MEIITSSREDVSMQHTIELESINKTFHHKDAEVHVLQNINLAIKQGEFLTIVGASGCGKSTLLRIIAGLDSEYEGSLKINNQTIRTTGTDRGMVFQDHRLYPWLSVAENIGFGIDNIKKVEKQKIISYYIDLMGLNGFERAKPHQLSGGMSQRVAIARALVKKPKIILFDEPFGALDALTRIQMQQEILKLREKEEMTMILVTHDIEEAILLGDRVLVMSKNPGRITQDIQLKLSRPRDRNSPEFVRIKEKIFNMFFSELKVEKFEDYSI